MMKFENLLELIKTVSESKLSHFKYEDEVTKLSMGNEEMERVSSMEQDSPFKTCVSSASSPAVQEETPKREEEIVVTESGQIITCPLVGTFYASPTEGTSSFVQVGDHVKKGQTLAIVEAMKLMNDIECEVDGVITEILVENGKAVEYGQPLFRIL
ncbi:MAG: acetyl-CoA carboxylase biotin carboxyl carrier protein [Lachnospiraceae bacterium]